jgi:thiol-disulfide isomerase/thioredoxin
MRSDGALNLERTPMSRSARLALALLVCGLASPVQAGDRPANDIVKDIDAIKRPTTRAELDAGNAKRAELIGELAKSHPDDARLAKLLPQRWVALAQTDKAAEAVKDIDAALARAKNNEQKLEGLFFKTMIVANFDSEHLDSVVPAAEEFVKIAPKDQRAGTVLHAIASNSTDKAIVEKFEDRILKEYPGDQVVEQIKASRKKREKIGKPFELEFTDAIKGSTVSMKGLKGKVVVVDFWATWCGPCVAEMPKMKKLYAEYKDKGVEFIGVSLDQSKEQGGLDKLKKYVADNEIGWPQYYQGKGWQSEFSVGWDVNSIPCVFIVDAEGNLYSTEARGKLDKLIPELLSKKAKTSAGGGQ